MEITALRPFEYQIKLRDFLRKRKKLWSWFANKNAKDQFFDKWKKELLKDSYRMDRESHPELYAMIDDILLKSQLSIKVIVYQEQMSYDNNVSIAFYNEEAHIIFSGRVLKILTDIELKAVLAHELYHYYFFSIDEQSYEIADRIITSISNDGRSTDIYIESARLFKLYMELYCDRGAFMVMKDIDPIISSLVKLTTGVDKVNANSYLNQADEILNSSNESSSKQSHPETFVRAKSISLWAKEQHDSDAIVASYIEPKINYEKLNVFSQNKLSALTKDLIKVILRPSWNRTPTIDNLAKQYSSGLNLSKEVNAESLFSLIEETSESTKKYLSYVLLDFALVDPGQEDAPLGYAFELAENGGLKMQFKNVVKKELKLTERSIKEVQTKASQSLNAMNESKDDSLYGG